MIINTKIAFLCMLFMAYVSLHVFAQTCATGVVAATANATEDSISVCTGDAVQLVLSAPDAENCTGSWEYLWFDGSHYYDGSGFNAITEVWHTAYNSLLLSSATQTTTYKGKIRCTTDYACTDSSVVKLIVNPVPVCSQKADIAVCPGEVINIGDFVGTPSGTTFTWTNSNTAIGLVSSGNGNILSWTAPPNCIGAYIVGIINVTPFYNGCPGPVMSFNVSIYPCVNVNPIPDKYVCPGELINIGSFISTPSGASFTWTNSNTAIGLGASGSGNIPSWNAPANNTCSNITSTITVTPTLNGCPGPPMSFTVTILPTPQLNQMPNIAVCPGQLINVGNFSCCIPGFPGCTYTWTNSNTNIGLTVNGSGNIPSWTAPANNTGSNITGTITITPELNGCFGLPMSFTVTIKPKPAPPITSDTACCFGQPPPELTASGSGTVQWYICPPSFLLVHTGNVFHPGHVNVGVYTYCVAVTENQCQSDFAQATLTIHALPPLAYTLSGNDTICTGNSGATIMLSGSETGVYYQLFKNALPEGLPQNGTGSILLWQNLSAGVYTVEATYFNSACSVVMNDTITINLTPLLTIDAGVDQIIPQGSTANLTATVSGGSGNYTYQWEPASLVLNPNSLNTFTTNLIIPTHFILYVTDNTYNCTQSDTVFVHFNQLPLALSATASTDTICAGDTVFLSAQASGGSGVYSYTWTSNPAGFVSNAEDTFAIPQTTTKYIITINDGFSTASDSITVVVNALPALYTLEGDTAYCAGMQGVTLTLNGSQTGVSYQLYKDGSPFGSALAGTGSGLTWDNMLAGTYTVTATNSTAPYCSISMTDTVSISEWSPLQVDAGPDQLSIYWGIAQLNASVTGGSGSYLYQWEPALLVVDPNVDSTSTIPLTMSQQFVFFATDSISQCTYSDSMTVYLSCIPLSVTVTAQPVVLCSGDSVQLNAIAYGGSGSFTYSWVSAPQGFTSSVQNPVAMPDVSTTYTVIVHDIYLTGTDTASVVVTVNSSLTQYPISTDFFCLSDTTATISTGGSDTGVYYQLYLNNTPFGSPLVGTGAALVWDMLTAGSYYVEGYDTTGLPCSNYLSNTLNIGQTPIVALGNDTTLCDINTLILSGPPGNGYAYTWLRLPDDTLGQSQYLYLDYSTSGLGMNYYVLFVSDTFNCTGSDTIGVNFQICPSVAEYGSFYPLVYPNPASDYFIIETQEYIYNGHLWFYNVQGQVLAEKTLRGYKTEIETGTLPSGLYILKLTDGRDFFYYKVVRK